MGTLYQLTSPVGKSYIGISSKTTEARWAKHVEHACGKREAGAIYAAIRKYGPAAFTVRTLAIADDWNYLCDLERRAIVAFNSKSPHGYNITDGGEGTVGRYITESERKKISEAQKKRYERPGERERLAAVAVKAREATSKKWAAQRIDGLAKWQRDAKAKRVRLGSEEHKKLISAGTKTAMARPEVKAKVKECAIQRSNDPDWRKKISASKKGKGTGKRSSEWQASMNAGILAAWADPVKKAARLEKNRLARMKNGS